MYTVLINDKLMILMYITYFHLYILYTTRRISTEKSTHHIICTVRYESNV